MQEHDSRALYLAHRRVAEFSEQDCDTRIRAKYIKEKDSGSFVSFDISLNGKLFEKKSKIY